MTPPMVFEFDEEWFSYDDEGLEEEFLGELFYRDSATGRFTRIDATHLPHFVALYESDEDRLN